MKIILHDVSIVPVKDNPVFFDIVANRVWKQWWEAKGQTENAVADGLRHAFAAQSFCGAFAAVHKGAYVGSAMVIESDMDDRPEYSPWIAGIFVEPQYRGQGIGATLVTHAAQNAFQHGASTVYLCATRKNATYYDMLGWTRLEENVGPSSMTIFTKTPAGHLMIGA